MKNLLNKILGFFFSLKFVIGAMAILILIAAIGLITGYGKLYYFLGNLVTNQIVFVILAIPIVLGIIIGIRNIIKNK